MTYGHSRELETTARRRAIAAVFVAMTTAEAVFSAKVSSPVEHVVVAGLAMASLAWRRRAPLAVAAIVSAPTSS